MTKAGTFVPKSFPDDPAIKSGSEPPGLASEYGGFKGGTEKIDRTGGGNLEGEFPPTS
tara:strand:- start:447 stop:620 length:174 start_codon:yes stop_codon:yes gene_type:complete